MSRWLRIILFIGMDHGAFGLNEVSVYFLTVEGLNVLINLGVK
jgi:hypothetical protein